MADDRRGGSDGSAGVTADAGADSDTEDVVDDDDADADADADKEDSGSGEKGGADVSLTRMRLPKSS